MTRIKLLLIVALLIGFAAIAHAGFDEGKAAFGRGDYAKAYEEFKKLAVLGHVKAQGCLGEMHFSGKSVPQDYAEAAKWSRKAGEQGFAAAQNNPGMMYEEGGGVRQDYAEAVKWLRKAAGPA